MRILFLAALAGTSMLAATPAFAQDRAPFTGPRVEVVAGGDRVQGGGDHDDGILYGVGAGYDFALSNTIRAGIEIEATDSTQKECVSGAIRAGDRLCAKAGRDLYAGARIGALVGPKTMVYAKAGYSNARFSASYDANAATGSYKDSGNVDGVRLGLGLEHMLGEKAYVKGEYRYTNYEAGGERHQLLAGVGLRF
ncbi:porin family protein [Sphingomonas jatrophae]|uniref:Outer membrane immunogenic protein n=1 Tax=Sphingomonas jatrophae TaxID=1166337 RepID=A0A1I6LNL1_9SPHN|nr:porin family protein [Sphingomonas jatrophae]SFS05021.1 outer membrane immunogenic protein [Sphingomonas jatrophae]